jgi:hypothetical protein
MEKNSAVTPPARILGRSVAVLPFGWPRSKPSSRIADVMSSCVSTTMALR